MVSNLDLISILTSGMSHSYFGEVKIFDCLVRLADKPWQKKLLADLLWEKNIAECLIDSADELKWTSTIQNNGDFVDLKIQPFNVFVFIRVSMHVFVSVQVYTGDSKKKKKNNVFSNLDLQIKFSLLDKSYFDGYSWNNFLSWTISLWGWTKCFSFTTKLFHL